jgi:hypothetical protein
MRRFVLSLVLLLAAGSAAHAQDQLRGVYGPPSSAPSALEGVYGAPETTPAFPRLPSTVTAPDYGSAEGGAPHVTVAGVPGRGQALPRGVKPSPIPGRPGYGEAVVNGRRAIIDLSTNRIFQILN